MFNLWKHQAEAIDPLLAGHYMLAFDPGLGKTLTAMTAMKKLGIGHKFLVVVPSYLVTQWAKLLTADGHRVYRIRAGKEHAFDIDSCDVVITSYNLIRTKLVWMACMKHRWSAVILDESHHTKNTRAKTTRAVFGTTKKSKALYKQTNRVWLLTGTPVDKDPTDLWVMLSRLFPDVLTEKEIFSKADFLNYFCVTIDTPYGPKVVGTRREDELAAMLSGKAARVHDNGRIRPHLLIDTLLVDAKKVDLSQLTDEARDLLEETQAALEQDPPDLSVLTKSEIYLSTLRRLIGEAKAEAIARMIIDELAAGVGKIVVFYTHVTVGELLEKNLMGKCNGGHAVRVGGGIPAAVREERKHAFQHDADCKVFIGQMTATGEGIDGLQVANRVLVTEPAWTPRPNMQAIRRVARGGSEHTTVYASYVVMENSIDEVVQKVVSGREKMIEKVFGGT